MAPSIVRPIIIINVYRPPKGNLKNCCALISEAFDKTDIGRNAEIYILGDFNTNYGDLKAPNVKELDFTMKSLGLSQLVKERTRSVHSNGICKTSILDFIFTNSQYTLNTKTLDLNVSDHLAVMITRKKIWVKPTKLEFKGHSYKKHVREASRKIFWKT